MVKPRPDQKADYGREAQGHTFFAASDCKLHEIFPICAECMEDLLTFWLKLMGNVGKYSHLGSFLRMLK